MKRHALLVVFTTMICAVSVAAQDWKQKQFLASADDVYQAAVKVIGLHHEIKSKDPDNRLIKFHVGTTAWSWGYNMGLSVEPQSDSTSLAKVAIEKSGGPAFSWGSGKKEVDKIFRWIEEELIKNRSRPSSSPGRQ